MTRNNLVLIITLGPRNFFTFPIFFSYSYSLVCTALTLYSVVT